MLIDKLVNFNLEAWAIWPHMDSYNWLILKQNKNLRVDHYLPLKHCWRQCTLLPPTWAASLTKFNPKMQGFKRVLDLKCK